MRKSEKQGGKAVLNFSAHKRKRYDDDDAEVEALFKLPLAEFTGARNTLAARLKKSGRGEEAARVKALAKPPISAWAVNQLYWNHREAFARLIASGEGFHKAQTSGKAADMREALEARREAITHLSDLATSLLRDAGNNPSLDTVRRITATLEGMSAYAQRPDGPHPEGPGRLTDDVDPPGFESFGSFVPAAGIMKPTKEPPRVSTPQKSSSAPTKTRPKAAPGDDVRQLEGKRKAKIAAAKVSLQDAKRLLSEARARAQSLEAAQKRADSEAKKSEKHRRDVEASLEKAKAAAEDAAQRARSVAVEVEEAATSVEDAERTVEEASKELESLT